MFYAFIYAAFLDVFSLCYLRAFHVEKEMSIYSPRLLVWQRGYLRQEFFMRYALYNAAKYVCHWDPTFAAYLAKKRDEGKHYNLMPPKS